MVNNVQIQNGDMVSMAKIVNENTKNLDSRIKYLTDETNRVFGLVEKDIQTLEKRGRINAKGIRNSFLCIVALDVIILSQMFRLNKLEKELKELQDEKTVDNFMKDWDQEEDSLK